MWNALTHPWVVPLAFPLTRGAAPVFMLHRFADPDTGRPGHDTDTLRAHLSWLRRHRVAVLPLAEVLRRFGAGEPVHKTVVFTVDDGYADFADRGLPVFAEFDCPVTVFLTTDFLDGRCWLWWNVVECLVQGTARDGVRLEHDAGVWEYRWRDSREREAAILSLVERLKTVPEACRKDLIARLGAVLEVELTRQPTPAYAPLSWDAVRRCARSGVSFGPHTLTHPILARTGDAQSAAEIAGSWHRVRQEAGDAAVPVFCYPNGDPDSFGVREQNLVAAAGLAAAVTTVPGYVTRGLFDSARPHARHAVPRMPYAQDDRSFVRASSGLERATLSLRMRHG